MPFLNIILILYYSVNLRASKGIRLEISDFDVAFRKFICYYFFRGKFYGSEVFRMSFQEQLNHYIEELGVSNKEVADVSGLSAATISRYRAGGREPKENSIQIRQLAAGLACFASEKKSGLKEEEILAGLNATVTEGLTVDSQTFLSNLNLLLKALEIRSSELARALKYDPSHVSKILSGARQPGSRKEFIYEAASYVCRRFAGTREAETLARLTGASEETIRSSSELRDTLIHWLGSNAVGREEEPIPRFLRTLDEFDLNEFMKAIRFNEMKLPPAVPHLPVSKTYFGIEKMMESELDFMKTTVLSRSMEDCILYSDMPLQEMAADPEFPKKWMFGMAMMLKKGLHLHIIHDVNRPFPEMMLGLEGNIPMYMTGQISPYYLPASQSSVFTHLLKVSGAAALEGSAIAGWQGNGKYVLYRAKEDIKHYRGRAKDLLRKALPLMDIYREERKGKYLEMLDRLSQDDDRRMVCSSLPLFTMSEPLLQKLLASSALSEKDREAVLAWRSSRLEALTGLLSRHRVHLVVPCPGEDAFAAAPLNLALADLFIDTDVPYTYEGYLAHLEETRRFAENCPNLTLEYNPAPAFHNINFTVAGDKQVIISKEKSPTIHFVIHHKKMVQAFRNFIPPIVEG